MIAEARQVEIVRHDQLPPGALAALLKMLWSPSAELNAGHLEWKYTRNPYSSVPLLYAAMAGDSVVGMRGIFGCRWEAGTEETFPAMCAGDLVVAPEYRSRGILTAIMNRAFRDLESMGVNWLFNFSAGATTRLASLVAGWGTTPPIERMRRSAPNSLRSAPLLAPKPGSIAARVRMQMIEAGHRIERGETPLGSALRRATRWDPFASVDTTHVGENAAGVEMTSIPRPMAMADLAMRGRPDGKIRHVRDEQYFGWRFQSPLSSYRFFFLGRSELDAYLVLQARQFPMHGRTVRIADWIGVTPEARQCVLKAALDACTRAPLEVWTSSLGEEDRAALSAFGFMSQIATSAAEYTPAILVRPVASRVPSRPWSIAGHDLLASSSWNLSLLDSDGC